MRCFTTLLLFTLLVGCGKPTLDSPKQRLQFALDRLAAADSPEKKFYALGSAAKESFAAGKTEDALKYAQELMAMLPDFNNRDISEEHG